MALKRDAPSSLETTLKDLITKAINVQEKADAVMMLLSSESKH